MNLGACKEQHRETEKETELLGGPLKSSCLPEGLVQAGDLEGCSFCRALASRNTATLRSLLEHCASLHKQAGVYPDP